MSLEDEAKEAVLEILADGLLRIRAFAWAGKVEMCAVEADHLHNLPELVKDFKWELLEYYVRCQRNNFANIPGYNTTQFQKAWERLDQLRARRNARIVSRWKKWIGSEWWRQ
jgi:hypothetical protein